MAKTKDITRKDDGYNKLLSGVIGLLEEARRAAARSVDSVMTATYWDIGRRIVEHEQGAIGHIVHHALNVARTPPRPHRVVRVGKVHKARAPTPGDRPRYSG